MYIYSFVFYRVQKKRFGFYTVPKRTDFGFFPCANKNQLVFLVHDKNQVVFLDTTSYFKLSRVSNTFPIVTKAAQQGFQHNRQIDDLYWFHVSFVFTCIQHMRVSSTFWLTSYYNTSPSTRVSNAGNPSAGELTRGFPALENLTRRSRNVGKPAVF